MTGVFTPHRAVPALAAAILAASVLVAAAQEQEQRL